MDNGDCFYIISSKNHLYVRLKLKLNQKSSRDSHVEMRARAFLFCQQICRYNIKSDCNDDRHDYLIVIKNRNGSKTKKSKCSEVLSVTPLAYDIM